MYEIMFTKLLQNFGFANRVINNIRFTDMVVKVLNGFIETKDMVKFMEFHPTFGYVSEDMMRVNWSRSLAKLFN